jgi:hypothetical protein
MRAGEAKPRESHLCIFAAQRRETEEISINPHR